MLVLSNNQINKYISIILMSHQDLPIFKVIPLNRKIHEIPTLKRKDSKQVISSLKQEMNNIRQGMSKLLRVKSQQNILISDVSASQVNINLSIDRYQGGQDAKNVAQKLIELEYKFEKLEEQNRELKSRIGKLVEENRRSINQLQNKKQLLEIQNNRLEQKICDLTQQLQTRTPQKKLKKPPIAATPPKMNGIPAQSTLNPQCIYIPAIVNQTLILMQQQKLRLVKDLGMLQMRIKYLDDCCRRNNKLIFLLNEESVKDGLVGLNAKYGQHNICQ